MKFKWNEQKVLITGGASGIGRATALRMLRKGARLAIWDFNQEALESFRKECSQEGMNFHAELCDVSDYEAVDRALAQSIEVMGGLNILVNNAGYVAAGNFLDRDFGYWKRTIQVNLEALMYLSYKALPHLEKEERAHMVNLTSAGGVIGTGGLAVYSAAKWAVWGFSESLRHEMFNLNKRHVFVTSIHPSYLASGMFEGARLRGLGALIVPPVKSHDHVARVIVRAVEARQNRRMIPRSVASAIFFRGILPDSWFQAFMRVLNVHTSMDSWKGRGSSVG